MQQLPQISRSDSNLSLPSQLRQKLIRQRETQGEKSSEPIIDPIKQLIEYNNPLPILAMLDYYSLDEQIQPGKPLINFLCNKLLPLEFILNNKKVQLKADNMGRTPLHYAVDADDVRSAIWCLENGNPEGAKDQQNYTPIMIAVKKGYRRCFLLLLEYGHYDQCTAHIAAAYNRPWELEVLNTLHYNFTSLRDIYNKTPIEVAVESYSYEAAEYLARLAPKSYDIKQLKILTDSNAMIRRVKNANKGTSWFSKALVPFLKVVFSIAAVLYLSQKVYFLSNYKDYYLQCFGVLGLLYLLLIVSTLVFDPRDRSRAPIMTLLRSPQFPTLGDICSRCLHEKTPDHDHCSSCNCCVRGLHFHDWVCINRSNQMVWAIIQFFWLYMLWHIVIVDFNDYRAYGFESAADKVPVVFLPIVLPIVHLLIVGDKYALFMDLLVLVLFLHQLLYCLKILGIIFMGKTYQQVSHSERYELLYRPVKLENGIIRNKQIKLFENGILEGVGRVTKNICTFFVGA